LGIYSTSRIFKKRYSSQIKIIPFIYHNFVISIFPNNRSEYKNQGNAYSLLDKYHEAITCYDEAIRWDQNDAAAWTNKENALYGLLLNNAGEGYEQAIECYDKTIAVVDGAYNSELLSTTFLYRGQSKYNIGKISKALLLLNC
jgi:tetratricopeptide (TPR) repeat protein